MIPEKVEWTVEINFVLKSERCFFVFEKREEGVPVSETGWDDHVVCSTFVRDGVVSGDSGNDEFAGQGSSKPKMGCTTQAEGRSMDGCGLTRTGSQRGRNRR